MARKTLACAMDFKAKKGDKATGRYSYRNGEEWYLVYFGPKYQNVYRITDFTEEEEKVLLSIERKPE